MSRALFALILIITCESVGYASDKQKKNPPHYRYEVSVGWGGISALGTGVYYIRDFFGECAAPPQNPHSLENIYKSYEGPTYATGEISAEFAYCFRKWFTLSLNMSYGGFFCKQYSSIELGKTLGSENGFAFSIMPEAKFNYMNKKYVTLYGSIGLGVMMAKFRSSHLDVFPAIQVVPIGITVGNRVFGFFETGVGTTYYGGMAGIGVRF